MSTQMISPGVEDLRAAWQDACRRAAARAGQPAPDHTPETPQSPVASVAGSSAVLGCARVVTVLGASGGAGASTVALGLAEAAAAAGCGRVRLLDPQEPVRSGLICAAESELGGDGGWLVGQRGGVHLDRRDPETRPDPGRHPSGLPTPRAVTAGQVVVIDQGTVHLGGLGVHVPAHRPLGGGRRSDTGQCPGGHAAGR